MALYTLQEAYMALYTLQEAYMALSGARRPGGPGSPYGPYQVVQGSHMALIHPVRRPYGPNTPCTEAIWTLYTGTREVPYILYPGGVVPG